MSNELHSQIHNTMRLKETDELLTIWQINNRVVWSDTVFEVIEDILKNRGVEIPNQNDPIYEESGDHEMSSWEDKILDEDNQPELYDPLDVLSLIDYLNLTLKAFIVITILPTIVNSITVNGRLDFGGDAVFYILMFLPKILVEIAIVYFSLKALIHILRILMEMEFNSRKGQSSL